MTALVPSPDHSHRSESVRQGVRRDQLPEASLVTITFGAANDRVEVSSNFAEEVLKTQSPSALDRVPGTGRVRLHFDRIQLPDTFDVVAERPLKISSFDAAQVRAFSKARAMGELPRQFRGVDVVLIPDRAAAQEVAVQSVIGPVICSASARVKPTLTKLTEIHRDLDALAARLTPTPWSSDEIVLPQQKVRTLLALIDENPTIHCVPILHKLGTKIIPAMAATHVTLATVLPSIHEWRLIETASFHQLEAALRQQTERNQDVREKLLLLAMNGIHLNSISRLDVVDVEIIEKAFYGLDEYMRRLPQSNATSEEKKDLAHALIAIMPTFADLGVFEEIVASTCIDPLSGDFTVSGRASSFNFHGRKRLVTSLLGHKDLYLETMKFLFREVPECFPEKPPRILTFPAMVQAAYEIQRIGAFNFGRGFRGCIGAHDVFLGADTAAARAYFRYCEQWRGLRNSNEPTPEKNDTHRRRACEYWEKFRNYLTATPSAL